MTASTSKHLSPPVILVYTKKDKAVRHLSCSCHDMFMESLTWRLTLARRHSVPVTYLKIYEKVIFIFSRNLMPQVVVDPKKLKTAFCNHICGEIKIDNKLAKKDPIESGLTELRNMIIKVAKEQAYWGQKRPIKWCLLAHKLDTEGAKLLEEKKEPWITLSEVQSYANQLGVKDEEEITTFLTFHHNLGDLIYFDDAHLRDIVILYPQWLVKVFRHDSLFEIFGSK